MLIGAALLLSTAAIGVALAAADLDFLEGHRHERRRGPEASGAEGRPLRLAEEGRGREHHARQHQEEDDDDDDDEGGGRGAIPQTGPADPNAPLPDNDLFNSKARPKVEVQ
ncbi:hypothetical protein [Methylocella sp.]|uniref:hypothetical protein n=1 Tax=Methylocella sp. TaxID=1978226 RepID=UPI0035B1DD44